MRVLFKAMFLPLGSLGSLFLSKDDTHGEHE